MRTFGVTFVMLVGATIVAASASGASSGSVTIKIPLPPPNTVQFSLLGVKSAAPIKVSATNAKQLGSRALDTQAIVTWRSKSKGTYDVMVVIHRFAPVRRLASGSGQNFLDLLIEYATSPSPVKVVNNSTVPCTELLTMGLLGDASAKNGWNAPDNMVPAFDTPSEEQLDVAAAAKCPGAEKPDPGAK